MSRIDGRAIWRAWALVREAKLDLFEPGVSDRLPALPGWSALQMPGAGGVREKVVTLLDSLRALSLLEGESGPTEVVRLVGTLPVQQTVLSTRDVVREIVSGAANELHVIGFAISETKFKDLLMRQAARGVKITVVGDRIDGGARELLTHWPKTATPLAAFEDVMPVQGETRRMHAKAIVADRARALVGSANFTLSGLGGNLEFGLLVEGAVAKELCAVVERLVGQGWLVPLG